MKASLTRAALCAFACLPWAANAQDDAAQDANLPKPTRQADADRIHRQNLKKFAGNADMLVLPGLVAKRSEKRVEIVTERTPVSKEEAVEFLVVHTASSHGYESFMWSYAKPGDIRKALEFIGIAAGAAYNPQALQFWPKGERIVASIKDEAGYTVRMEELIYDKAARNHLPPKGFIFTGSAVITNPHDPTITLIVADAYEPHAVISGFSSSPGVMEPSWIISKGAAYQRYQIHSESDHAYNEIHTLLLEPENKEGGRRIRDLNLTVEDARTLILAGEDGKPMTTETSVQGTLDKCLELLRSGQEPHLTLKFNDEMSLGDIREIAGPLALLDRPDALRIGPPAEGRLYYRSFIPPDAWRDPQERMSQAWEVHITGKAGELAATMVMHEEVWKEGRIMPDLQKLSFDAPNAEALRKRINDDAATNESSSARARPKVLFIYARADLKYRDLLSFLKPLLNTHKTIHVFIEGPSTSAN